TVSEQPPHSDRISHTDDSPVFADISANAEDSSAPAAPIAKLLKCLSFGILLAPFLYRLNRPMTLRIEKAADRHKTIIRLSGRLQSEHLDELKMQVDGEQSPIGLDLEGVTLVDIEVVRFLNACEKSGVELLHCWPYIREWMIREKAREG